MKVVHLSTSDRGGAGLAASRIHEALLRNGVDSHLLTLYHFQDGIPNHTQYLPGSGTWFPALHNFLYKLRKASKHSGLFPFRFERMAYFQLHGQLPGFEQFSFSVSELRVEKHPLVKSADIIHLHWISEGFIDYETFFTGMRKKIIWTLHDMNPFTGGCHHADDCRRFTDDCGPCPQLLSTPDEYFAEEMLKQKMNAFHLRTPENTRIVSPSNWLKQLSSTSTLFRRFPHQVIPNAGDDNSFTFHDREEARKKLNLPSGKRIVLFIAHHVDNPRKGAHFLMDALSMLGREDVLLCSAGDFLNKGAYPQIHNFGYVVDHDTMSLIYSAADVFVLPSVAENFPNTICESFMCGTPVVSFREGGIPELVNETNGRLAPLKDAARLKDAIAYILDHASEFNREEIRRNILLKIGSAEVAEKYLALYTDLLHKI